MTQCAGHHTTPRNGASRQAAPRRRRGLSLVEALISLALTAVLLTAVAASFTSAASVVAANDDMFRATQAARVTLNQILSEIRRADSVQVSANQIDVIRPAETAEANEVYRSFRYDAAARRITLQVYYTGGVTSPRHTMARNVIAATIGPAKSGTDSAGKTVVARVPIAIRVRVGDNSVTLNGSAGPRRALPR